MIKKGKMVETYIMLYPLPVPYQSHLNITFHFFETVEVDLTLISTLIFSLIWRLLASLGFYANLLKSIYEKLAFINGSQSCIYVESF